MFHQKKLRKITHHAIYESPLLNSVSLSRILSYRLFYSLIKQGNFTLENHTLLFPRFAWIRNLLFITHTFTHYTNIYI